MDAKISELPKVGELLDFIQGISPHWNAVRDERKQVVTQLKVQQHESDEQKRQIRELNEENKDLRKNLDDTKLRLSRYMGLQMTNNNPNIADLSDENRPTKIAEMYNELYDNTWTDAYEKLQGVLGRDERRVIELLRTSLMMTRKYCDRIGDPLLVKIREALFMKEGESFPDFVLKLFKDNRRKNVDQCLKTEYKKYLNDVKSSSSEEETLAQRYVPEYMRECFKIGYLMSIQDPPVVFETKPAEIMDPTRYRMYTVKGDMVDYIVWPCVLLNEGGAVLSKGVAQCFKLEADASIVQRAPPSTTRTDRSTTVRQAWEDNGSHMSTENKTSDTRETGDEATGIFEDGYTYQHTRKEAGKVKTSDNTSPDQDIPDQVTGSNNNQPIGNSQQTVARSPATSYQSRFGTSLRNPSQTMRVEYTGNTDQINTVTSQRPSHQQMDTFKWYLATCGEARTRQVYGNDFESYKYFSDH